MCVCECSSRWQDIVVGAPQFFQRDGEVGGAVYVYINKAGKWSNIVPTRLNGTKDSMFGLAVENIGDINLDSYEGGNIHIHIFNEKPGDFRMIQNKIQYVFMFMI